MAMAVRIKIPVLMISAGNRKELVNGAITRDSAKNDGCDYHALAVRAVYQDMSMPNRDDQIKRPGGS